MAYKLAVLVYQCVHGPAPAYLADALQPVAGLPGRPRLRSSSTSALAVPLTWLSTIGDRAFPAGAARTWSSLLRHFDDVTSDGNQKWRHRSVYQHLRLTQDSSVFHMSAIADCKVTVVPLAFFTLNFVALHFHFIGHIVLYRFSGLAHKLSCLLAG